ncbi:MAG TPA: ribose-phosphate diphosphokinase [Burkholderiaceae bacterium]|nr:ribose-phosphate diphosphokinase [Burkholderiaceae bacterium]
MLLAFEDEWETARRLARECGRPPALIERHRFPDGELKLRLPAVLPEQVVFLRSLAWPNEKLVELLLAARTARELGARHLSLVAPYLGYMRQDIAFVSGEAVSQRIVGTFLAGLFDCVITVDPHLHRIDRLQQAVPLEAAIAVSAAPVIGAFLREQCEGALVVGPDEESEQWVRDAAEAGGLQWAIARKTRRGDRDVTVELPAQDVRGRAVVLLDDVASTGTTLARAAHGLRNAGACQIDAVVTHGLFVEDALAALGAAGVGRVWSTDTVAHATNAISVLPLLATAVAMHARTAKPKDAPAAGGGLGGA